jgi:hypothetical protein
MTHFPGVVDLRISIFIFDASIQSPSFLECKFAVQEINRPIHFVYTPAALSKTIHPLQGYSTKVHFILLTIDKIQLQKTRSKIQAIYNGTWWDNDASNSYTYPSRHNAE